MVKKQDNIDLPATPARALIEALSLPQTPPRFNTALMGKHSDLLGQAGELLSQAYSTANSVATIARIVRRSQVARELDDECLTSSDEDHLLGAVTMLLGQLSETLCLAADRFEVELTKGGAQ